MAYADEIKTKTSAYKIITVNYGKSLRRMISSGHYYTSVDPGIKSRRFRIRGRGTRRFEVIEFRDGFGNIGRKNAVKFSQTEEKLKGWKIAKIEHLLAYGEQHMRGPRRKYLIAYGQGSRGHYPLIRVATDVRELKLIDGAVRYENREERLLFIRKI